ncbi:ubiquitin domain-containing protein TINCR-like [Mustelus asterias]
MYTVQKLLSHWTGCELIVQLPDGQQKVTVRVRPNDTIKRLRLHLVRQGVTSWKMDFTYNGQQLGENETLEKNNITPGAVLVLVKKATQNQFTPVIPMFYWFFLQKAQQQSVHSKIKQPTVTLMREVQ